MITEEKIDGQVFRSIDHNAPSKYGDERVWSLGARSCGHGEVDKIQLHATVDQQGASANVFQYLSIAEAQEAIAMLYAAIEDEEQRILKYKRERKEAAS